MWCPLLLSCGVHSICSCGVHSFTAGICSCGVHSGICSCGVHSTHVASAHVVSTPSQPASAHVASTPSQPASAHVASTPSQPASTLVSMPEVSMPESIPLQLSSTIRRVPASETLRELHSSLSCLPLGWCDQSDTGQIKLCKIASHTQVGTQQHIYVSHYIAISVDMSWKVFVNGHCVDRDRSTILYHDTVMKLISVLDSANGIQRKNMLTWLQPARDFSEARMEK